MHRAAPFCAALLTLALAACAQVPADPAARAVFEETNDPLEPLNREIFDFNLKADRYVIKPIAQGYVAAVPEFMRTGVRNFLDHLNAPVVFANLLLQAEFKRAGITALRFFANTMVGFGGVGDPAAGAGLEKQTGDFGQTLFVWGVPDGPYLMLPIFGPSNPRDTAGSAVDGFLIDPNPMGYLFEGNNKTYWSLGRQFADGIDKRSRVLDELEQVEKTSIDFYAQIRSLWRQKRTEDLYHGSPPAPKLDDTLYDDPEKTK